MLPPGDVPSSLDVPWGPAPDPPFPLLAVPGLVLTEMAAAEVAWPIGKSRVLSEVMGSGCSVEVPSRDSGEVLRYSAEGLLMVTSLWLKLVTVMQAKNSNAENRVVK